MKLVLHYIPTSYIHSSGDNGLGTLRDILQRTTTNKCRRSCGIGAIPYVARLCQIGLHSFLQLNKVVSQQRCIMLNHVVDNFAWSPGWQCTCRDSGVRPAKKKWLALSPTLQLTEETVAYRAATFGYPNDSLIILFHTAENPILDR